MDIPCTVIYDNDIFENDNLYGDVLNVAKSTKDVHKSVGLQLIFRNNWAYSNRAKTNIYESFMFNDKYERHISHQSKCYFYIDNGNLSILSL